MQRLEVSGAVRLIYKSVVRHQRAKSNFQIGFYSTAVFPWCSTPLKPLPNFFGVSKFPNACYKTRLSHLGFNRHQGMGWRVKNYPLYSRVPKLVNVLFSNILSLSIFIYQQLTSNFMHVFYDVKTLWFCFFLFPFSKMESIRENCKWLPHSGKSSSSLNFFHNVYQNNSQVTGCQKNISPTFAFTCCSVACVKCEISANIYLIQKIFFVIWIFYDLAGVQFRSHGNIIINSRKSEKFLKD